MKKRHLIALLLGIFPTSAAFADNITYTIDPTRSSLTLSGYFGTIDENIPLQPQVESPNSLVTAFGGTITTIRDLNSDTLQITGGSVAAEDSGVYAPFNVSANYGISTDTIFFLNAAIRDLIFSPSSPVIASPVEFDSSQLSANIVSGTLDYTNYNVTTTPGGFITGIDSSYTLSGDLPLSSSNGFVTDTDGIETLAIPFQIELDIQANGQPVTLNFSGNLIATAVVPEPASVLVLVGGLTTLGSRSRRRQKLFL